MTAPALLFRCTIPSAKDSRQRRRSRDIAGGKVLRRRARPHPTGNYHPQNYSFLRPKKGRTGAVGRGRNISGAAGNHGPARGRMGLKFWTPLHREIQNFII
jgi:hypothetical protein